MRSRDWLNIEGGPVVVLSRASAPLWRGGDDEQYDLACSIDSVTGTVSLANGAAAFVIADEPLYTCYVSEFSAIVQWIYAESESDIDELLITDNTEWYGEVQWSGADPILFAAVWDGSSLAPDEYIDIPGIDGDYVIRSADVVANDRAAFRIHQFSPLN